MEPPQAQRGSPPALDDNSMYEIFLRVPPDDPKTLVRAAAVCTTWRRILGDILFTRQHRKFHRVPPMVGFLRNTFRKTSFGNGRRARSHPPGSENYISSFVSTASFPSPACHERRDWRVLDSRHGLILYRTPTRDLVVCDLVTDDRWSINLSPQLSHVMNEFKEFDEEDEVEDEERRISWNAAVICAKDPCDHTFCHYGPFLVALVGTLGVYSNGEDGIFFASVYSSKTRDWSNAITITNDDLIGTTGNIAVVGDRVYFQCRSRTTTVEYNIGKQELEQFMYPMRSKDSDLPYFDLMGVDDDGMLLYATVKVPKLYLYSTDTYSATRWERRRVINFGALFPARVLSEEVSVVGFAEGVGVIFLSTAAGLYTIELRSGRRKKVLGMEERIVGTIMPYMSFYTKAWGRSPTSH